jgi:NADH-quinone oxidoreductase subunit N
MNALIIVALAGVVCMMAEVFRFKKGIVAIIALALVSAGAAIVMEWNSGASWYNYMLLTDNYALAFSAVLIVTTMLWLIMGRSYFSEESNTAEHSSLILFALAGGIIMVSYSDLTMFFIGLEVLSISLYVLAGSDKRNVRSNEAGLKYFLMGAFATGFLLFGIALIYGATGTFNLEEIAASLRSHGPSMPVFVTAGVLLIMVGLCFKIAAVPFHFWAPDVYEGAPTLITAFMATVVKTAAFAAFYRLFSSSFVDLHDKWAPSLAIISAISMIGGNVLAVWQQSLKRMLAYSSIAHAGYMLMAVVAFNEKSGGALLLYAASYSLSSMGAFALLHAVSVNGNEQISSLRGLARSNPFVAVLMIISLLSLAGIPPVAGFFAKYYLFTGALQSGYTWLVLTAVASSLIGVYYYFRVLYTLFQDGGEISPIPASHKLVMIITAVLSLVIGIMPALVQQLL